MIPEHLSVKEFAFDEVLKGTPLRAIDVLAPGTLFVEDIEGNVVSYPFDAFNASGGAYSTFPYRLHLRIRRVLGDGSGGVGNGTTGTDIALANLVGIH